MITLTDNAIQELRALLAAKQAAESAGLRLGVQRGGCAGLQYTMQVAEAEADDTVVEQAGVRVFLAPDSLDHLRGCEIDYSTELSDAGFKIVNPNAARACGCGTSFEPKEEGVEAQYDPALDGTKCS
jgi:iron-sulfur cluster assembly accessory protein